nr:hypothetical protein [Sphingomonas sp. ZFBP2030]
MSRKSRALPPSPFRRFISSPEVIRLVVMMYVRFPLSLRNVEDLLFECGIDICHETVRMWWNGSVRPNAPLISYLVRAAIDQPHCSFVPLKASLRSRRRAGSGSRLRPVAIQTNQIPVSLTVPAAAVGRVQ